VFEFQVFQFNTQHQSNEFQKYLNLGIILAMIVFMQLAEAEETNYAIHLPGGAQLLMQYLLSPSFGGPSSRFPREPQPLKPCRRWECNARGEFCRCRFFVSHDCGAPDKCGSQ
jgi:hypothetical protein